MIKAWEWIFTSSVLIGALLLLRRLLRGRLSRRLQYGLWLAAMLRLLIPFSFPAAASVANVAESAPVRQLISGQVIRIRPALSEPVAQAPILPEKEGEKSRFPLPAAVWVAGSTAVGGWLFYVNLAFGRRLRRQRRAFDIAGCPLPVYLAEGLPSPCLFGLLRPAVYLTPEAASSPDRLRHVLAHECCHYRQRDPLWSLLRALCLTVHWFNPLVWAAALCSRTDCELACDERTVQALGEGERLAYGKTLVDLVHARQTVSLLGCMATTMALGRGGLKQRIQTLTAAPKTVLSGLCIAAAGILVLVGCTFTGAKLSREEAVRQLKGSIAYAGGSFFFTVPSDYPDGEDWNIQIYGTAAMGEGQRSVHFFEKTNTEHTWKPGSEYQVDLGEERYLELGMDVSLNSGGPEAQIDLLALRDGLQASSTFVITFPAYEDSAMQQNALVSAAEPFHAVLALPEGWQVELPQTVQGGGGPLYTVLDIVETADGERRQIASMGFNCYTPYEGEDGPPPEEIYKTVYYELRLGRMEQWDPYMPVRTDENGESGIAEVYYVDGEYLRAHPDASLAQVPMLETKGILCYNEELAAYVGIRFMPDAGITDAQLRAIAEGLRLEPTE